jgi:hypothetical protein
VLLDILSEKYLAIALVALHFDDDRTTGRKKSQRKSPIEKKNVPFVIRSHEINIFVVSPLFFLPL